MYQKNITFISPITITVFIIIIIIIIIILFCFSVQKRTVIAIHGHVRKTFSLFTFQTFIGYAPNYCNTFIFCGHFILALLTVKKKKKKNAKKIKIK